MKSTLLIFSFIITSIQAFSQNCEAVVAYDFNNNTTDISVNEYDATLYSAASTAANYLATGYNDDDRAEIPAAALNGISDFTISFDFYLNELNLLGSAPTNTIIAGASATDESEFAISYQANIAAIVVALKGSGDVFPIELNAENWYCLTVKREINNVTVFINGTEVASIEMSSLELDIEFLEIGQELDCVGGCYATNQSLNGRIDNLSIYPCALDNSSCQSYITECDTLLNYKFNGTVLDAGVYAHNGILNAGATVSSNILEIGYNDNDYVEIPSTAADGLDEFAISFNFYLNNLNEDGSSPTNTFIAGTSGINTHELALSYEASSNAFEVAIHEVGGIIPATILPGTWYCVTFYRKSDSVWIELDGTILPTVLTLPEGPLTITFLEIGQELDCPEGCFAENQSLNGKMDNLIIQDCSNTINCTPASLSIYANLNNEITINPNPANNWITVNGVNLNSANISITNLQGQKLLIGVVNNTEVNITHLQVGMYFIIIENNGRVMVETFIKE